MGDSEYKALRLGIAHIDGEIVSGKDAEMFADAVEQLTLGDATEGAASVARFTAKFLPKQAEGMRANGGLDLAEVDLSDDDVMNNVGVCCGMVRFVTSVLDITTDEGVWHPVKGPGATGPKCVSDQMLMSHAPMLLVALRDTMTVLTRVLTNGEKSPDVSLFDEMGEYMNAIADLHRNMVIAQDIEREADGIVKDVEALLDALPEDVGIVPINPFGTKNGEHTA